MFRKIRRIGNQFAVSLYNAAFNRPVGIVYMLHRVGLKDSDRLACIEGLKVSESFLERLIERLRPDYDFIQLDELEYRLRQPEKKYQKPFAVFTFDDGYRDNYEYAYPIFRKNNVPFSVFLTYDFIDNPCPFNYPFIIERIISHYDKIVIGGKNIDCATDELKNAAFRLLKARVMKLPYDSFKEDFKALFNDYWTDAVYDDNMLTWEQIREMQSSDLCVFGSHTMTHCVLSNVPNDKLEYELGVSKKNIENRIGCAVNYISYPFGWFTDVNDEAVVKTSELGYHLGFMSFGGAVRKKVGDLLMLNRQMLEVNEM